MNPDEKREKVERALGPLIEKIIWYYGNQQDANISVNELIDALAEGKDVIIADCEVEHGYDRPYIYGEAFPMTRIVKGCYVFDSFDGHHGIPGPATAIIICQPKGK